MITRATGVLLALAAALPGERLVHAPAPAADPAAPTGSAATPKKVEWAPTIEEGLALAAKEMRPLLLSLGKVGEARSEALEKELYGNRKLAPCFAISVNVAAWEFEDPEARKLPDFGDTETADHRTNLALMIERWLVPNTMGVIALPQHVWLSPQGSVLVSCPWEIDAEEFSWCFDAALRRAGIEERPELIDDAHPPRRLLLGEVVRVLDDDTLGRGLLPQELADLIKEKRKSYLGFGDRLDVGRILFTDEKEAVTYMTQQIGMWGFGGDTVGGITDNTFSAIGVVSPASFLDLLEPFSGLYRPSARAAIASSYEQIGDPKGLSAVKKAFKKEKDEAARAEWVRALGACSRGSRSTAKILIRMADKEKNIRVRLNAILAMGHLLPESSAFKFLTGHARDAKDEERQAAILALALGRASAARGLIAEIKASGVFGETERVVDNALKILDGGNLYEIEGDFSRVSGTGIGRQRLFFRGMAASAEDDE